MQSMPYSSINKGTLLIATPEIDTGIFFRSVILLCEHGPAGSFGLIINKNLELELPEEVVNLKDLANPRVGIRAGGPVQTNQMMLVHTKFSENQQMMEVCPNVYLGGNLRFLQETIADADGPDILICFGYSGWGGGQLEREFLDGSWLLKPADERFLFHTSAENLWSTLLREMGGNYASLSMIPEDLSLN